MHSGSSSGRSVVTFSFCEKKLDSSAVKSNIVVSSVVASNVVEFSVSYNSSTIGKVLLLFSNNKFVVVNVVLGIEVVEKLLSSLLLK